MRLDNSLEAAAALLRNAKHIAIVGHVDPDADTLGSGLGLWWTLRAAKKRADIVHDPDTLPRSLAGLPGFEKIKRAVPPTADLIVSLDCAAYDRIGVMLPGEVALLNCDHHRSNTGYGTVDLVDPEAVCTAQVLMPLLARAGFAVPKEAAVCFYAALVSDSGFFGYEGVDETTFVFAGELVRLGADPAGVARLLRERQPLAKVRILAEALKTLRLFLEGRVAGMEVTLKMLAHTGATPADLDGVVEHARSLATVEVGFLLRENRDGSTKISLRSKTLDVGRVAAELGGGGHARAAGATLPQSIETARERVLKILEGRLRREGVL